MLLKDGTDLALKPGNLCTPSAPKPVPSSSAASAILQRAQGVPPTTYLLGSLTVCLCVSKVIVHNESIQLVQEEASLSTLTLGERKAVEASMAARRATIDEITTQVEQSSREHAVKQLPGMVSPLADVMALLCLQMSIRCRSWLQDAHKSRRLWQLWVWHTQPCSWQHARPRSSRTVSAYSS